LSVDPENCWSQVLATRYDKRAYVFHGTVTVAAIRLWLGD
jgi:hypothetical protein